MLITEYITSLKKLNTTTNSSTHTSNKQSKNKMLIVRFIQVEQEMIQPILNQESTRQRKHIFVERSTISVNNKKRGYTK